MVKGFCLLCSLIISGTTCFSQSDHDTSIHKTAIAVCNCLEKSNIGSASTQEEMQQIFLGCMMDSASEAIANIMFSGATANPETAAEEFGKKLAVELMNSGCKPFVQMSLKFATGNTSISDDDSPATKTAEGEVVSVEEKDFLYITIKTTAGRELSLIYLSYVPESDEWVKKPNTLVHKKVSVKWTEREAYQPKLKEFVNIREIKELHIN